MADDASGLRIINISSPTAPTEVGFHNTPGYAYGVAVSGNYAYVADYEQGLRVVNITSPSTPIEVGFYDTPGIALRVSISGSYAYVGDRQGGLRIIDISNPSAPTLAGFYATPSWAHGVAVSGNHVYVADFNSGLRIINISNPAAPVQVGFYDTPGQAYGVAVSGNYAYVADGPSGFGIYQYTGAPDEYPCEDGSISGVVRDQQGNPISEALVTRVIAGDVLGRRTNSNGQFSFEDLSAGSYSLQISHWQYDSQNHSITLGCNEIRDNVYTLVRTPNLPEIDTVHVRQTLDVHQDVLVAGKTTVVIARLKQPIMDIDNVKGVCWVHINDVPRPLFIRSETESGTEPIILKRQSTPQDREQWKDALYFRVDDIPESQNVKFEVQLIHNEQDVGPVKWSAVTEFTNARPLTVWFVPLTTEDHPEIDRELCRQYMNLAKPRLKSMLPYSVATINTMALWPESAHVDRSSQNTDDFAEYVIQRLVSLARQRSNDFFVGLFPLPSIGGHSGVSGWYPRWHLEDPRDRCMVVCNAEVPTADGNATLVAHEMGHSVFHRDDYGGPFSEWRLDYWGLDAADPIQRPDFDHRGL
ncbi:carboxypeptidase regulatory-like domain-containing protein [bacterium]|nr:carboxypeptidase regulatory-like domain-containing protein [bacterium]MBU1982892.1 carboxypeptidase regulatory-like domain-containing protein [bacterium]